MLPGIMGTGLLGLPWRVWGIIVVVVSIVALLFFFGQSAYNAGVSAERSDWESRVAKVQHESQTIGADEANQFANDTRSLNDNLAIGSEQIEAAALHETRALFLAWALSDQRLCGTSNGACGTGRA